MRLVTRADFDGLVCGALVTRFESIDDYLYVEPKFMQDGLVEIRSGDIIIEYDGTVYNEKGLDIRALSEHRKKTGSILEFTEGTIARSNSSD